MESSGSRQIRRKKMKIGVPISTGKTQYSINSAYIDYVSNAGMTPLMISPKLNPNEVVKICDGLLLPGGVDIEPTYYNEDNVSSFHVEPEKDSFERLLLYAFVKAGKPIFGICRGFQLILREYLEHNNAENNWLCFYQHINEHSKAESLEIPRTVPSHSIEASSSLYGIKPETTGMFFVNSMHHQGVIAKLKNRPVNSAIKILAWTSIGLTAKEQANLIIVEGFRIRRGTANILAVQWHPEELRDVRLIRNFFLNQAEQEKVGVQNDKCLAV